MKRLRADGSACSRSLRRARPSAAQPHERQHRHRLGSATRAGSGVSELRHHRLALRRSFNPSLRESAFLRSGGTANTHQNAQRRSVDEQAVSVGACTIY